MVGHGAGWRDTHRASNEGAAVKRREPIALFLALSRCSWSTLFGSGSLLWIAAMMLIALILRRGHAILGTLALSCIAAGSALILLALYGAIRRAVCRMSGRDADSAEPFGGPEEADD